MKIYICWLLKESRIFDVVVEKHTNDAGGG